MRICIDRQLTMDLPSDMLDWESDNSEVKCFPRQIIAYVSKFQISTRCCPCSSLTSLAQLMADGRCICTEEKKRKKGRRRRNTTRTVGRQKGWVLVHEQRKHHRASQLQRSGGEPNSASTRKIQ